MAQGGKGKKVVSLQEKKDAANTARTALRKEVEDATSMMDRMETMVGHELNEYVSQKKRSLGRKMKATLKKLLRKDKSNKKGFMKDPIVAATMKFHKDDDMDHAAARSTGAA